MTRQKKKRRKATASKVENVERRCIYSNSPFAARNLAWVEIEAECHVTSSPGTAFEPPRVIPPTSIGRGLVDPSLSPSSSCLHLQLSTMPPKPSLDKLLPPILNLLRADPPNPYSAHQKALTTTARLVRNGQPELACEILFNVARELLKAGDTASGAELGVRMIEIMGEAGVKVDDKSRGECSALICSVNRARAPCEGRPARLHFPTTRNAVDVSGELSCTVRPTSAGVAAVPVPLIPANEQPPSLSSSRLRRRGRGARSSPMQPSSGLLLPTVPPVIPSCSSISASCPSRVSDAKRRRRSSASSVAITPRCLALGLKTHSARQFRVKCARKRVKCARKSQLSGISLSPS